MMKSLCIVGGIVVILRISFERLGLTNEVCYADLQQGPPEEGNLHQISSTRLNLSTQPKTLGPTAAYIPSLKDQRLGTRHFKP